METKKFSLKTEHYVLIGIFLLVLALRLYFAFQPPNFNGDYAYFNLRQIESIKETGKPIFNDELSFSGRTFIFSPVFQYLIAIFTMLGSTTLIAKLIPNIFASLIVLVSYLLCKEITKDWRAGVFAAFASGFIPIYFSQTFNQVSEYTIVIPLFLLTIYFFLKLDNEKKYMYLFIVSMAALIIMHTFSVVLLAGLLLYLLIVKIEKIKGSRKESEAILFCLVLSMWFYVMMYKQAILSHGATIIWQNAPSTIIGQYFARTNVIEAIAQIGILPFIFGIYVMYSNLFGERKKPVLLLTGIAIIISAMLLFKAVRPVSGMMLLGSVLLILLGCYFKTLLDYTAKTKVAKVRPYLVIGLLVLFIATSVVPSIIYANTEVKTAATQKEITALQWLKENSENGSIILGTIEDGHLITEIAGRKNVIDSNFLQINNINEISDDVDKAYTTQDSTTAIEIADKYHANYLYFSPRAKEKYKIQAPAYSQDSRCFELIYSGEIQIFRIKCRIIEFK